MTKPNHLYVIGTRALLAKLHTGSTLPYMQVGVSTLLAACAPHPMTWQEIGDCLYGADLDGGPMSVRDCIEIAIMKLRRLGVPIKHASTGFGYYMERAA